MPGTCTIPWCNSNTTANHDECKTHRDMTTMEKMALSPTNNRV